MNDKPLKCWDCARLGKCERLKPCTAFRRYPYKRGKTREYTLRKLAPLCGVHYTTLVEWIRKNADDAVAKICERSGLRLKRVQKGKLHVFVEEGAEV